MINLKILRWEHFPRLPGRTLNVIIACTLEGREGFHNRQRRRCEDRGRDLLEEK